MSLIIGLIFSMLIGVSLGLIGGGGSIITVPVLVYVIGVDVHRAVGMSLAVVGATSLVGAVLHYQRGNVNIRTGTRFSLAGIVASYLATRLTHFLSPQVLMLTFGCLMLVVAGLMLRRKTEEEPAAVHHHAPAGDLKAIAAGVVVGGLTGFLGVGGGFLIVPALVLFGDLKMKDAIGTSLMVIAVNCASGLVGQLTHNSLDLQLTLLVTALAVAGTLAGSRLSHRSHPAKLRTWFAVFMICVALFLVAKNITPV